MKPRKIFTVLGLICLFAILTAFTASIGKNTRTATVNPMVRHVVDVILSSDNTVCGSYVVEIRNEFGVLVAPPQNYTSEKSIYVFYERDDMVSGVAVRTAQLRKTDGNSPVQCVVQLYAQPSSLRGYFEPGYTYPYLLQATFLGDRE